MLSTPKRHVPPNRRSSTSISDSGSFDSTSQSSDYNNNNNPNESPSSTSHQPYWKNRFNNFKNSILGTPRFHRKNKLTLNAMSGNNYADDCSNQMESLCDSGPNLNKKSWFGQLLILGNNSNNSNSSPSSATTATGSNHWSSNNSNSDLNSSTGASQSILRSSNATNNQVEANNHVHVVLIKDRPLTVIKADLIHTFFSSPDVVHQILSPMSFRVEFKRPSGTTSMFQRSVKLQIDIASASGSSMKQQQASNDPTATPTMVQSSQFI